MTKAKTFWQGKHAAQVRALQADLPVYGEVKDKARPMLEEWRKLQNAYYRYHNDGDAYYNKLRHMAKRFGVNLYSYNPVTLEELADAVFKAAVNEQARNRG